MHAKSLQSSLTLCNPMDGSLPSSSVHEILQARILERIAMPCSRGSSPPRDQTCVSCLSCIGRQVLDHWRHLLLLLSRFSRVRLCDPMDRSPPGSSVHGIFQARALEWGAIAFSTWQAQNGLYFLTNVRGEVDC